jgi:hypothetical protein
VWEEAFCVPNEKKEASFAETEQGLNLRSTSSYAPELGCAPSKPRSAPRAVARADRAILSTELSTLSKRVGGTPERLTTTSLFSKDVSKDASRAPLAFV